MYHNFQHSTFNFQLFITIFVKNKPMIVLTADKGWFYHLVYWITALLPVILGFGLTMLMIWYFTKNYKGPDDLDEFENDN